MSAEVSSMILSPPRMRAGGSGGFQPMASATSNRVDSLSAMRASLEQISRVVNSALVSTQQQAAAGRQPAGRYPPVPAHPFGGYSGLASSVGLLDSLAPSRQQQNSRGNNHAAGPPRSLRSVAVPPSHPLQAWGESEYGSEFDDRTSFGGGGVDDAGLGFLGRWKDDRDMAQELLQQHSSWLRGFREQVGAPGDHGDATTLILDLSAGYGYV